MSLFGALLGDFDDDGFMGNPISSMNMQMRNMNRLMSSMMMPDPFNMLTPFDNGFNSNNSLVERGNGGLFGLPSMPNMYRMVNGDMGGNGASFCSSSVISMSSGPDGRPQIYQATSSTKTGPGGIRETRKTVQDSSTGVKKMAIGHHIGERAHIIEKEQNLRSGQHEERQEFINLEEEEAESFDREFTNKARMRRPVVEITDGEHHSPRHRSLHRALPAPPSANSTSSTSSLSSKSSATTTKTPTSITPSKLATPNKQSSTVTPPPSSATLSSSSAARRAMRNASMAAPRRPLRTPLSSPLALTSSGSSSASTTTSVHPHPYNNAAARRNFRSKHQKAHHHSSQQQQQPPPAESQPEEEQQQEESPNNEI